MLNVQTPASRAGDPITSARAEQNINASGRRAHQQRITRILVEMFPGSTSAELARDAERYCLAVAHRVARGTPDHQAVQQCQLDRYQIARRLKEVETAGAIERRAARKCAVNGRQSQTWGASHGR